LAGAILRGISSRGLVQNSKNYFIFRIIGNQAARFGGLIFVSQNNSYSLRPLRLGVEKISLGPEGRRGLDGITGFTGWDFGWGFWQW
jgi:hypothetical protein